jgi:16S rRNA processing protein RimM
LTKGSSSELEGAERYVALAEVARPHGVRGELRLKIYNPDSEVLLGRPAIRLASGEGETRPARLESVRRVPGALLVRLEGVSDREAAEHLRGVRIEVLRSALQPAADGEYYCCDLEGCEVLLAGERIGRVTSVASYPTCDALVVARDGAPRLEVPLVDRYLSSVDVNQGRIVLRTIDELE